jgi:hypothetical protein
MVRIMISSTKNETVQVNISREAAHLLFRPNGDMSEAADTVIRMALGSIVDRDLLPDYMKESAENLWTALASLCESESGMGMSWQKIASIGDITRYWCEMHWYGRKPTTEAVLSTCYKHGWGLVLIESLAGDDGEEGPEWAVTVSPINPR